MIASYFYDDGSTSLTTGKPVSVNRGGQNYYYHYNAHGDVVRITDQSGAVVASYDYDAWGNITSSSGSITSGRTRNAQPATRNA